MIIFFYGLILIGVGCIGYMFGLATNRKDGIRQYKKGYAAGKHEQTEELKRLKWIEEMIVKG